MQSICNTLERYGYETITLNVPGLSLGWKKKGDTGYAVVTIDETTGHVLEREQFYHISGQIRDFIRKKGCYHSYFLYLLVTEEDGSAERLFGENENYWRIVPTRGQVMVYETSNPDFMELRRPLENLFPGRQAFGGVEGAYGGRNREQTTYRSGMYTGSSEITSRLHLIFGNKIPWCNMAIVLLNVLIFLVTDFFLFSSNDALVEWGALGWQAVFERGEWYRIFTSMFMHGDAQHIFGNMLVLAYLGSCLEQQIGSVRYFILYLGSGILAGCASMVYNMMWNDYTVSIGASGAIFGVMGAMLFLVIFLRNKSGGYNIRQIAVMLFFSLYGGFANPGVDNAAHVGGLVAGFLLCGVLCLRERVHKY